MTETMGDSTDVGGPPGTLPRELVRPERAFSISIVISGIRCSLTYVALPFLLPLLGFAPGIGPILGITIGIVAIAANVYSMRRFRRTGHPWRQPMTVLHVGIIALLLVLMATDVRALIS
jgi:formate hydrogenlyase subunit 3/multisubunit Na+/H+ antiporter MnhD subunit